ncbi:hypothetical protein GCM10007981_04290 [Thermocladium modestius]|uniref:Uncharacterized protein n=1 Tax=Thermocladium modestius TaxID=62609 RepID=A0A830GUA8_9CREN|nr:hypothetical protein GCM10007981_04290 [Thermocladium modestius]
MSAEVRDETKGLSRLQRGFTLSLAFPTQCMSTNRINAEGIRAIELLVNNIVHGKHSSSAHYQPAKRNYGEVKNDQHY